MIGSLQHQKRETNLSDRIGNLEGMPRCTVPFCNRPTRAAAGVGLSQFLCTNCTQKRARHGSAWCPSIRAGDLRPYVKSAARWIRKHHKQTAVHYTLLGLQGLLDASGKVEAAMNIKRRPAALRAKVAFARLREAGIKTERLLATHIGVSALIADDPDSHRITEYRLVQTAKAVHRLASGTHRVWQFPMVDGTTRPLAMHVYPKSSGRVLRAMGKELEEICAGVSEMALQAVRDLKTELYGPHPSKLPGWLPRYVCERQARGR